MKGSTKTVLTFGEDFALVQVPVAFAPVVSTKKDVATLRVGPSGEKVQRQEIDPKTGEVLTADKIDRAVANGVGVVRIDADDWKTITDETKPTEMVVTEFVDPDLPIVRDRLTTATDSHYVQAQEGAAGSLAVLVNALADSGKVAIVRWGAGSRQRLGILRVGDDGALRVQTVPFAADIQPPDEEILASNEPVSDKAAKLGKQLIKRLSGKGETLETAEDEAVKARKVLVEASLSGKKPKKSKKADKPKETDVESALEAALG